MYIGLTGFAGTGKDTVASLLTEAANRHGFRVFGYNLSEVIKEELDRRGEDGALASRATLIQVGNELRATDENGVLARRMAKRIRSICPTNESEPALFVIAGIRSPFEADVFRAEWGKLFRLLAVETAFEVRIGRMAKRGQYHDDTNRSTQLEEADQAIGIRESIELSDWTIENNSSVEHLRHQVETLFERIVLARHNSTNP
jgi:dephospho-CoA kinase